MARRKNDEVDLICTLFTLAVVGLNVIVIVLGWIMQTIVHIVKKIIEIIKNNKKSVNIDNKPIEVKQIETTDSITDGINIQATFDSELFKKYFKECYPKAHRNIIKTLKLATEKTFFEIIKNIVPTLKAVKVDRIVYNKYRFTCPLTLENIKKYGLPVNPISFQLIFEFPIEIGNIDIKSSLFDRYSDTYKEIYRFTKHNYNKNAKKYDVSATNVQYAPELFDIVLDLDNCTCKNLELYIHGDTYPVLYLCPDCGKLYMCECQKQYYDELFNNFYKGVGVSEDVKLYCENYKTDGIDLYKMAEYKNGICDLCRKELPIKKYRGSGTELELIYKPYIDTLYDYYRFKNNITDETELKELQITVRNEIVADRAGFYNKGEKWISETILYKRCCKLFPNYEIIRQYSPDWLGKQRIDIYIKEMNVAIEYQGEQHYKPIDLFGGEEGFQECKKRDKLKKELCKKNNVNLVYFKYNENLSEKNILKKLQEYSVLKILDK